MDKLWAPWRAKYITKILKINKGCVFCSIAKEKKDKRNYIFIRTRFCYAVLNLYPYNNGHCLIIPFRHIDHLSKLKREEREDLFILLDEVMERLEKILKPGGFNIGINLGRAAGAGFPGHVHIHVGPRWHGDVNFMPVLTNTKVVSQSLNALFDKLSHARKKRH